MFREEVSKTNIPSEAKTYVELKDLSDVHKYKLDLVFVSFKPTLEFEKNFDYVHGAGIANGASRTKIRKITKVEIDEIF